MPRPLLILVLAALLGGGGRLAFAQPPRGPLVVSPQVNAGKTVTFRYLAPSAREVLLNGGQFGSSAVPMTKDTAGIWSVTVGLVKPDMYLYSFQVDGVTVMDPANVAFFPNERFKASLVDVPGDAPLMHAMRDVPHGTVTYEYYPSVSGTTGSLVVYTPPGYDQNPSQKYPVFYLISGTTDTEETFFKVGKINFIPDNLLAEGKAKPMIIVMPYGNVRPAPVYYFTKEVVSDIVPFVEANYPVVKESKGRAVAGFSVGGGQTLNIGLTHPDKFAYVCSYAPYTATDEFKGNFTDWSPNAAQLNKQLKLFTISVGTEDFLYEAVKRNIAMFEEKKLAVKSYIVPGGHTWMNCKQYLATTLPALFQ